MVASTTGYSIVPRRHTPAVIRTAPAAGRADVPLNTIISIVFSEPMDSASVAAAVRLTLRGAIVPGTVSSSPDDSGTVRFELHPLELLNPNATYTLEISDSARNSTGTPLETAVAIEFTTLENATAPPPVLQASGFRMFEFVLAPGFYRVVPQLRVLASPLDSNVYLTAFTILSMPGAASGDYPWSCFTNKRMLPGIPFEVFQRLSIGDYPLEIESSTSRAGSGDGHGISDFSRVGMELPIP